MSRREYLFLIYIAKSIPFLIMDREERHLMSLYEEVVFKSHLYRWESIYLLYIEEKEEVSLSF